MKKTIILWILTVVCLIGTIFSRFAMDGAELEYEEVKATVVSASSKTVRSNKYDTQITTYDVDVSYNGKIYNLKNVGSLVGYSEGRSVTAYLSGGNMYANEAGVRTSTPIAMVYFGFLFATFILFFWALISMSKKKKT